MSLRLLIISAYVLTTTSLLEKDFSIRSNILMEPLFATHLAENETWRVTTPVTLNSTEFRKYLTLIGDTSEIIKNMTRILPTRHSSRAYYVGKKKLPYHCPQGSIEDVTRTAETWAITTNAWRQKANVTNDTLLASPFQLRSSTTEEFMWIYNTLTGTNITRVQDWHNCDPELTSCAISIILSFDKGTGVKIPNEDHNFGIVNLAYSSTPGKLVAVYDAVHTLCSDEDRIGLKEAKDMEINAPTPRALNPVTGEEKRDALLAQARIMAANAITRISVNAGLNEILISLTDIPNIMSFTAYGEEVDAINNNIKTTDMPAACRVEAFNFGLTGAQMSLTHRNRTMMRRRAWAVRRPLADSIFLALAIIVRDMILRTPIILEKEAVELHHQHNNINLHGIWTLVVDSINDLNNRIDGAILHDDHIKGQEILERVLSYRSELQAIQQRYLRKIKALDGLHFVHRTDDERHGVIISVHNNVIQTEFSRPCCFWRRSTIYRLTPVPFLDSRGQWIQHELDYNYVALEDGGSRTVPMTSREIKLCEKDNGTKCLTEEKDHSGCVYTIFSGYLPSCNNTRITKPYLLEREYDDHILLLSTMPIVLSSNCMVQFSSENPNVIRKTPNCSISWTSVDGRHREYPNTTSAWKMSASYWTTLQPALQQTQFPIWIPVTISMMVLGVIALVAATKACMRSLGRVTVEKLYN